MSADTRQVPTAYAGQTALVWLTLFTSAGTLVCCALPILLVSLGLGAAVASLTSSLPWLVALSHYKAWIFGGSLLLLSVSAWAVRRPARRCPADPRMARLCARLNRINRWVFSGSLLIWLIGFFAAFLLLPVSRWLNG